MTMFNNRLNRLFWVQLNDDIATSLQIYLKYVGFKYVLFDITFNLRK
jgi:hypothetical protein